MTTEELKRVNDDSKKLLFAIFLLCFVFPALSGIAFRVFRVFAGF